jgi:hypothetical protein
MNERVVRETAWVGDEYVKGKIKGIMLFMHGLAIMHV